MKRLTLCALLSGSLLLAVGQAAAEDPFAGGEDALAVAESDGSASVRARLKMAKLTKDMVVVKVKWVDDKKFPKCTVVATVLQPPTSKDKYLKLLGRNKVYKFQPVLKMRGRMPNLRHKMTQNNLGACYYPKKTKLTIKVAGVDLKKKVFKAAEIYTN